MSPDETKKFSLGRLVATPGALEALQNAGQTAGEFLARHVTGDFEEVSLDHGPFVDRLPLIQPPET